MKFHISDVLSITTECLVSNRNTTGVYEILNYMTDDNLYTHQLPRAARECKPFILKQYPQLANVDISKVNSDTFASPENHQNWINEQAEKYGEFLEIEKLPKGEHNFINPLVELQQKIGQPQEASGE